MRLAHQLIPIAVFVPSFLLTVWLLKTAGIDLRHENHPALFLGAVALVLFFAGLPLDWWLCRFLGIPPLFVFAPACPYCHKKPGGWRRLAYHMPKRGRYPERVVFACGLCGEKVELWLRRRVAINAVDTALPSYRLRWPEFLGIWRRLRV